MPGVAGWVGPAGCVSHAGTRASGGGHAVARARGAALPRLRGRAARAGSLAGCCVRWLHWALRGADLACQPRTPATLATHPRDPVQGGFQGRQRVRVPRLRLRVVIVFAGAVGRGCRHWFDVLRGRAQGSLGDHAARGGQLWAMPGLDQQAVTTGSTPAGGGGLPWGPGVVAQIGQSRLTGAGVARKLQRKNPAAARN